MANYTDEGLMRGDDLRPTTLNSNDLNVINSAHTFKVETNMGGLSIDEDTHADSGDSSAGRLLVKKGFGELETDGQVITLSRTGGTDWNSLTMRGPEHTSSVVELVDGTDKHLGQSNSHGARFGFCGVNAHTGSIAAGGLGVERNEVFFLQTGEGINVTNILDVSIADGEVFFYHSLRSTDGSNTHSQLNPDSLVFENSDPLFNNGGAVARLASVSALNDDSTLKEFANISGFANDTSNGAEQGRLQFNVMKSGSLSTGLEVYGSSTNAIVKISNTWTLPSSTGAINQVLMSDGAGSSTWQANAETDTLDSVTTRGDTTNNDITTGAFTSTSTVTSSGLIPNAGTHDIGSSSNRWDQLYLDNTSTISWGATSAVMLTGLNAEGLALDMSGEGSNEPHFTIRSDSSTGPRLSLHRRLATTGNVGSLDFIGRDSASNDEVYAQIVAASPYTDSSLEQGTIELKVNGAGTLNTGLKVIPTPSLGNPKVEISDSYTLPDDAPGSGSEIIISDGAGGSYWGSSPYTETDTLATVTGRGASTTESVTVADLTTTAGIISGSTVRPATQNNVTLGSSVFPWSDLYLGNGGRVYFDTISDSAWIEHISGQGLEIHTYGETDGEPKLTLVSTYGGSSVGPTLDLKTRAVTSFDESVGRISFSGYNSFGQDKEYVRIDGIAESTTNTVEDGGLAISTLVNGTMTPAITVDNSANTTVNTLSAVHSDGNYMAFTPGSVSNTATLVTSTSSQYNELALYGHEDSGSILSLTQGNRYGAGTWKGARFGYAGSATWETAFGAESVEKLFLQVGDSTNGSKNVLEVGDTAANDLVLFGDLIISDIDDNQPKLILRNDKGGADLTLSADDTASTSLIASALAGLTISTSTSSLSTLTLDSSTIVLDASNRVVIQDGAVSCYALPNVNDPATSGHVLVGGGVGNSLSFTTSLTALTNISSDSMTLSGDLTFSGNDRSITMNTTGDITTGTFTATNGVLTYVNGTTATYTYGDFGYLSVNDPPTWAAYGNGNDVDGVVVQQRGSNPFSSEDYRTGYWLIANDSTAANAPATPSDVGWVMSAMDVTYTMQQLRFSRTENAGTNISTIGYLNSQSAANEIDFTGQHRSIVSDSAPQDMDTMVGYIVVSDGTYANLSGQAAKPTINEALPKVTLSSQYAQKSVYGVISDAEDPNSTERLYTTGAFVSVFEKTDNRLIINAVGEGGIWVTNANGSIDNGDLITSSSVPGLGALQSDDIMRSYTVAKATQACNFDLNSVTYDCEEFDHSGTTYRRAFIGCTYHCG